MVATRRRGLLFKVRSRRSGRRSMGNDMIDLANTKNALLVRPMGTYGSVLSVDFDDASLVRQRMGAGQTLFEIGDDAVSFYILTRGALSADFCGRRGKGSYSLLAPGTMFSLACDARRFARCKTTADSEFLRISRKRLDQLMGSRPALRTALHAVHAAELSFLLAEVRRNASHDVYTTRPSSATATDTSNAIQGRGRSPSRWQTSPWIGTGQDSCSARAMA